MASHRGQCRVKPDERLNSPFGAWCQGVVPPCHELALCQSNQREAGAGDVVPAPVVPELGAGAVVGEVAAGRLGDVLDAVVELSPRPNIMKMPKITASATIPPTIQLV